MKWFILLVIAAVAAATGWFYLNAGEKITAMEKTIAVEQKILENGEDVDYDVEEKIKELQGKCDSLSNDRTLQGVLLTFLTAGLAGVLFVVFVLPSIAHKFTHAIYDSGAQIERDPLADAHSLLAQGKYEEAVNAFKAAAKADPLNRLPWVEIAKVQRSQLYDSDAAIYTLREALEGQEWQMNDAAFLIFRLAEIYDEDRGDRDTAATLMQQVIDEFPETRHSANARHKLHEWGMG